MDFDATPLTDEDWAAADELLRRRPDLADKVDEVSRRYFAIQHARWGRKLFRRRLGLTKPRNGLEALHGELFQGKLTREEYRNRLREYAHRPVDEEMLKCLARDSYRRLKWYSRFLEAVLKLGADEPGAKIEDADRWIGRLKRKRRLFKEELLTVNEFLMEARICHHMSLATSGESSAPTADFLVMQIVRFVRQTWDRCREIADRSQTATTAWRLFLDDSFPSLPLPQELSDLVTQEDALGRLALKQQQNPTRAAERMDITLQAELVNLSVNSLHTPGPAKQKPSEPVLDVARWEDLAIGVDEHQRVWALTPAPDVGQVFAKSKAVRLHLGGSQWPKLLQALAEYHQVGQLDVHVAAKLFGLVAPDGSLPRFPGATAADRDFAYAEGLTRKRMPWRRKLNKQLRDLARRLRRRISGPAGKASACLRLEGDRVVSGFLVRYLVRDAQGNLRFGAATQ